MRAALRDLLQEAESRQKKGGASKVSRRYKECDFSKSMMELYERLKKDELKIIFNGEYDRYQKKHKENMFSTYVKARVGEDSSLWKLIKWDKSWLFVDRVRDKILDREIKGDKLFFQRLSGAIKKNTRFSLQSSSKINKEILTWVQNTLIKFPYREAFEDDGDLFKTIHEIYEYDRFELNEKAKLLTSKALKNLEAHGSIYNLRQQGKKVDEIFQILFPDVKSPQKYYSDLMGCLSNLKKGDSKSEEKIIENLANDIANPDEMEEIPLKDQDYFMKFFKRHGLR